MWSWNQNRSQEIKPVVLYYLVRETYPTSINGEFIFCHSSIHMCIHFWLWNKVICPMFNWSCATCKKLHHTALLYYNQMFTCKDKVTSCMKITTDTDPKQDRSKAQDQRDVCLNYFYLNGQFFLTWEKRTGPQFPTSASL